MVPKRGMTLRDVDSKDLICQICGDDLHHQANSKSHWCELVDIEDLDDEPSDEEIRQINWVQRVSASNFLRSSDTELGIQFRLSVRVVVSAPPSPSLSSSSRQQNLDDVFPQKKPRVKVHFHT